MAEYLDMRCCMCPNLQNPHNKICPGIQGTPHPSPSPCRFVKKYTDERGWKYFVCKEFGANSFKTFYLKPGAFRARACRRFSWQSSFDKAQADLNAVAQKKRWIEVH